MKLGPALLDAARLLEDAGVSVPRLTAEVILAHQLGRDRVYLYAHPERELTEVEWIQFGRALHERLSGKPTQYITGRQEFWGREFRVGPGVLIPRPETEHVVEAALVAGRGARSVLDVGTGSGALAVTLQLELGCLTFATEISREAAAIAAGNARLLGATVHFVIGDLLSAIAPGSIDLIVSNPPYVPQAARESLQREVREWEPAVALYGGETGCEVYAALIEDAPRVLTRGGWLILELGFGESELVERMLAGWREVRLVPDLAGIPRVIAARCP
jgi:release factor glutamine methyltransferase